MTENFASVSVGSAVTSLAVLLVFFEHVIANLDGGRGVRAGVNIKHTQDRCVGVRFQPVIQFLIGVLPFVYVQTLSSYNVNYYYIVLDISLK